MVYGSKRNIIKEIYFNFESLEPHSYKLGNVQRHSVLQYWMKFDRYLISIGEAERWHFKLWLYQMYRQEDSSNQREIVTNGISWNNIQENFVAELRETDNGHVFLYCK